MREVVRALVSYTHVKTLSTMLAIQRVLLLCPIIYNSTNKTLVVSSSLTEDKIFIYFIIVLANAAYRNIINAQIK